MSVMEPNDSKLEPADPDGAPSERTARQSRELAALPLLPIGVVFLMLTLLGAGLLAYALMGRGGILLGVLGAVQTFVCSAALGVVVRRWRTTRRPQP